MSQKRRHKNTVSNHGTACPQEVHKPAYTGRLRENHPKNVIDGRRHENMEDSREADSQEGDDASSVLAFLAGVTVAASGNEIWCVCLLRCVCGVVCLCV